MKDIILDATGEESLCYMHFLFIFQVVGKTFQNGLQHSVSLTNLEGLQRKGSL